MAHTVHKSMPIYLDNSATTRPFDEVVIAMEKSMREAYFNPSALYTPAMRAEREMERARCVVAQSVGACAKDVLFTSGGTESNNLAILGYMALQKPGKMILYSAAEHPAVKQACKEAALRFGHCAHVIPLTDQGSLDLRALQSMLNDDCALLCVMHVCNETGVIMPLIEVVQLRNQFAPNAAIHVDGVQGYLRIPFSIKDLGVQTYALSGHKIHGPKGVGALVIATGHKLQPQFLGGGQQGGLRSGTENTPGIAGLCAAVEAYMCFSDVNEKLRRHKETLLNKLAENGLCPQLLGVPSQATDSAGHILCVAFPPVRAETLLHALEAKEIWIGNGSACASRKGKRSAVLEAMHVSHELMDSAVRLSFSVMNTLEDSILAAEEIINQVNILSKFRRR